MSFELLIALPTIIEFLAKVAVTQFATKAISKGIGVVLSDTDELRIGIGDEGFAITYSSVADWGAQYIGAKASKFVLDRAMGLWYMVEHRMSGLLLLPLVCFPLSVWNCRTRII